MKRDKETCESVLLQYLKENEGWHKKVALYAIAEDWSPETVGRTLRDMHDEGTIFVNYYDGKYAKNLAMYAIAHKVEPKKVKWEIIEKDGKRVAVPVYGN